MLKKKVCKKCYLYNERIWDEFCEDEWSEGRIMCPVDYFNVISHKGKPVEVEGGLRNLFSAVFGWNSIDGEIPEYCKFKEEHNP